MSSINITGTVKAKPTSDIVNTTAKRLENFTKDFSTLQVEKSLTSALPSVFKLREGKGSHITLHIAHTRVGKTGKETYRDKASLAFSWAAKSVFSRLTLLAKVHDDDDRTNDWH